MGGMGGGYGTACSNTTEDRRAPEVILAEAFDRDLGVKMDAQALRIFIRWRWDRIQKLAHAIHDA